MSQQSSNPVGLTAPNYPRDAWWVATTSAALGAEPQQHWILDRPVVLYRGQNGQPIALDDRCPHRWAPLSMGKVYGDEIACGYHGLRFGADGRCTHVPTQKAVPGVARVRSYPVVEAAPFLWIWTGEPDKATEVPAPLEWTVDPTRVTASGAMEVGCNFLALKENVLDLSHFAYVHAETLAITDWVRAPDVDTTPDTVTYRQRFENMPLPAHYGLPTGIGCERTVDRDAWGTYHSPGLQLAGVDIANPHAAHGERASFGLRILHATTPIDAGRCRYWWYFSQDYGHGAGAVTLLTDRIEAAFLEDKAILEATEVLVRLDERGRDYTEISVACDRAGIETRRKVARLVEREAGE
jgi:phenylpropionate dioxygenase-like ring-hydroxylating dioxygenase large terminal subunit